MVSGQLLEKGDVVGVDRAVGAWLEVGVVAVEVVVKGVRLRGARSVWVMVSGEVVEAGGTP